MIEPESERLKTKLTFGTVLAHFANIEVCEVLFERGTADLNASLD